MPLLRSGLARSLSDLTKLPIALLSTLAAATGHMAFARGLDWDLVPVCAGVALLAMGACALNEWQERDLDSRMERTKRRPLPSGSVTPAVALAASATLLICGFLPLLITHHFRAAALGLLAVFWYNGVYTGLKRITAFAVVPGALIGALPPAIGWSAAGGSLRDPRILALSFLLYMWQVPHFWLLLFQHSRDYEAAGLPSLTRTFGPGQLARMTFAWTVTSAASCLLPPIYGLNTSPVATLGLALCGISLVGAACHLLRAQGQPRSFRGAFRALNIIALGVMLCLSADPYL